MSILGQFSAGPALALANSMFDEYLLTGTALLLVGLSAACSGEYTESEPDAAIDGTGGSGGSLTGSGGSAAGASAEAGEAAVGPKWPAQCADGLTLDEYCEVCNDGSPYHPEGCAAAGSCGHTLSEVLNAGGENSSGCGYVVMDFGSDWWGPRQAIFSAATGMLVGVYVAGDNSMVGVCGGYSTGAGEFPPEGCMCPCQGESCLLAANNTSCDAGAGPELDAALD